MNKTHIISDFGSIYGNNIDATTDKNEVDHYDFRELYNYIFPDEMPAFHRIVTDHPCCCVFYVSKRAILSHSKDFYEGVRFRLRNWSRESKKIPIFRQKYYGNDPSALCGRLMEYHWHEIFTFNLRKKMFLKRDHDY